MQMWMNNKLIVFCVLLREKVSWALKISWLRDYIPIKNSLLSKKHWNFTFDLFLWVLNFESCLRVILNMKRFSKVQSIDEQGNQWKRLEMDSLEILRDRTSFPWPFGVVKVSKLSRCPCKTRTDQLPNRGRGASTF